VSENTYPPASNLPPTAQPLEPAGPKAGNGFGIASLILGIVTMAGFAIPFLNFAAIGTGIAGVVLGIIGLVIKFRPRKAAIAGVILSGLGLILSIILVVVYTAAFAGAVKAVSDDTVPSAGPSGSASSSSQPSDSASFKDGVLTTSEMKIEITGHKIIPVGGVGNEYGSKPVIAFWYSITNLTDKKLDPTTGWMFAIKAVQDNNQNAVNELSVGSLPDEKFLDTQLEDIKNGGTVENAVAYELDDETTAVDLIASDILGLSKIGKVTYPLQ
jgi:hypothetical protein